MERNIGDDAVDVGDANASPVRRSFSFGKKTKPKPVANTSHAPMLHARSMKALSSVRTATIRSAYAFSDIGFALHEQAGWIIVSYVGLPQNLVGSTTVGDGLVALQGVDFPQCDATESDLDYARMLLREACDNGEEIVLTLQTVVRTEVLYREAALRGTSLDKFGLTLEEVSSPWPGWEGTMTVEVNDIIPNGRAAKSGRFSCGDRILTINDTKVTGLLSALELLAGSAGADSVEFELTAGFKPLESHAFDKQTGKFMHKQEDTGGGGAVRRSFSWGKKKRASGGGPAPAGSSLDDVASPLKALGGLKIESAAAAAVAMEAARLLGAEKELNMASRSLTIRKDKRGLLGLEIEPHAVTGELMISLIGSGSPASLASIEVGDKVLEINGYSFAYAGSDEHAAPHGGDPTLTPQQQLMNRVSRALSAWTEACTLKVCTSLRTEEMAFGSRDLGGPKDYLGLELHSFDDDVAVRVIDLKGPALKAGRVALGDRITRIDGVRVWNTDAARSLIAQACRRSDFVTIELALGHSPGKGLWYGGEPEDGVERPKTVKRSFSFGRKPRR